jgi:hypothetical protein
MNFDNKIYLFFQLILIIFSIPIVIVVLISSFIMTIVETIVNHNNDEYENKIKSNENPE